MPGLCCKQQRAMDLVLGPSPFSLGRDPSRRRPFPSVSPLERLVHTCAWEFWATPRSGCGRLTGTLSSVFCLGMWVPAGQAIGESGAHRRPVVLCALGCWCREETVDRTGLRAVSGRPARPHLPPLCCRWLWPTPCWQRSPAPAPALHILHCIHTAWRLPPATGLPTGLWRPTSIQ